MTNSTPKPGILLDLPEISMLHTNNLQKKQELQFCNLLSEQISRELPASIEFQLRLEARLTNRNSKSPEIGGTPRSLVKEGERRCSMER